MTDTGITATDLPSRESTRYQWLRVADLLSPTVEQIVAAYAAGDLMTREEVRDSLDLAEASDVMHEAVGLGRGVVVTSAAIDAVIAAAFREKS